MSRPVFAMYDKAANQYSDPIAFDNKELAIAAVRRQTRDMYSNGVITYDALSDQKFVYIGEFSNVKGTIYNVPECERIEVECTDFIDEGNEVVDDGDEQIAV